MFKIIAPFYFVSLLLSAVFLIMCIPQIKSDPSNIAEIGRYLLLMMVFMGVYLVDFLLCILLVLVFRKLRLAVLDFLLLVFNVISLGTSAYFSWTICNS